MSTQTQTTITAAAHKLDRIITRMRESDYDANTLHGQFIAAHEELKLALKATKKPAIATKQGRTKIAGVPLKRGIDLQPVKAA